MDDDQIKQDISSTLVHWEEYFITVNNKLESIKPPNTEANVILQRIGFPPYTMATAAVDTYHTQQPHQAMLDMSIADLHGPAQSEKVDHTQTRRASDYLEDEHFTTLEQPIKSAPPVIVFFSFMNPRSYSWAVKHEIVNNIRRNVPQGTSIVRYHAPMRYSWDFGEKLTHSWAVAESLHVDDRIIEPMFRAVFEKRVTDLEGIRTVFEEIGITPDIVLKEWAKPWVLNEKDAMDKAVAHVNLKDVPGILVQGKYMVNLDSFGDAFHADQAVDLVKDLLARP